METLRRVRLDRKSLQRLNYILIPESSEERAKWGTSPVGRFVFRILVWSYTALSREGRALLGLTLIAGIAGLDVSNTDAHVLWAILLGVVVGSVAARWGFQLDGVEVEVKVPPRVVVGEPATLEIVLRNEGERDHHDIRIERSMLGWDGSWTGPRPSLDHIARGTRASVRTEARFLARGWHDIDGFFLAAAVPFGLALGPTIRSPSSRVLVVPKVAAVRQVKVPTTTRFQTGGVALASKTGESMELFGLRPYRRGDRLRDLHAKTWARLGEPVVREYRQEYFTRIGVVVDTDLSQAAEDDLEAALSLAAGIVGHLSRGEALIDLLVTGRELHTLTLGRSLGTFEQALDHLGTVRPGPPFDAQHVAQLLAPFTGRLSSVIVIALRWDPERAQLVDRIRRSLVSCKPLVLSDAPVPGAEHVSQALVLSGRPLFL